MWQVVCLGFYSVCNFRMWLSGSATDGSHTFCCMKQQGSSTVEFLKLRPPESKSQWGDLASNSRKKKERTQWSKETSLEWKVCSQKQRVDQSNIVLWSPVVFTFRKVAATQKLWSLRAANSESNGGRYIRNSAVPTPTRISYAFSFTYTLAQ